MEHLPNIEKVGLGTDCYVRKLTVEKARELYPAIAQKLDGMPAQQILFATHHADGVPFALSDREDAAVGQGVGKSMHVWRLH